MTAETPTPGSGYGKRPMWQWVVIYLVVGAIVYGLIYYFVFAQNDTAPGSSAPAQENTFELPY